MTEAMQQGLSSQENNTAKVKMFSSYVRSLPNGTEEGDFLALDLGEANFRIFLVQLKQEKTPRVIREQVEKIPLNITKGDKLFDYIAEKLHEFVQTQTFNSDDPVPLGFTLCFPCKTENLKSAILVSWTKEFMCEGVVNQDVVRLLREAIEKKGTNVDVKACLNDTVGCLMAGAMHNEHCYCGVILDAGTNACYMEDLVNVKTWSDIEDNPMPVVINTEWGAFGDDGMLDWLVTEQDYEVDNESTYKGERTYEKMISGMYLGEIVRHVLKKLIQDKHLFSACDTRKINQSRTFSTENLCEIVNALQNDHTKCREIMTQLDFPYATGNECQIVRDICLAVMKRSAYLASAGIAAIINMKHCQNLTVAVDGWLYHDIKEFHSLMNCMIRKLAPQHNFKLTSPDGDGKTGAGTSIKPGAGTSIGAAIVASVAKRIEDITG